MPLQQLSQEVMRTEPFIVLVLGVRWKRDEKEYGGGFTDGLNMSGSGELKMNL